ncbi:unnamed protein product [Didymodactylos carnosus]|uniref:Tetratricopeptide repeat protein n=1 Tax=Didymodactylos carnosus TaxID=1234261 RepID=A0A815LTU3_9BILA|nr:unnamed protein product [Didymodactylos carnosus]CAF1412172.1 unnamed protein product [Didymodactylos carnosus]CAF3805051.1 unnamed protein product [Didymodactylos carnosus]CAF4300074.1 unnamed protein product [Didymodactylos carnosus]
MLEQGKFAEALSKFLHTLDINEKYMPRHPNYAEALNNVGFTYKNGDIMNATDYFNRALEFCQTHLSETHEMTAITYLALELIMNEDQYQLAVDYINRATAIYNHLKLSCHQNRLLSKTRRFTR